MNIMLKSKLTGARINHLDNDGSNMFFFLSKEIARAKDKGMKVLTVEDLTLHENEEIIEAGRDFYAHLFREEL